MNLNKRRDTDVMKLCDIHACLVLLALVLI